MKHAGLLGVLVLASACSTTEEELPNQEADEITAGELVAGASPYYWANISFEQYEEVLAMSGGNAYAAYTADDDPLRVRLQQWADRFDAAMRRVTRNEVAPKPIVKLLKSAQTFNAWSAGTYASLGVPFGAPLAEGESFSTYSLLLHDPKGFAQELASEEVSLPHPREWNRLASFTQVWNLANGPCKLSAAGGRITASACEETKKSPDTTTIATTPFVVFASDLVAQLDENAVAFVMAHELAHMYRAHSSPLVERKYDFWYDHGPNVAKRPVASGQNQQLKDTYQRVSRVANALDYVVDATLHVRSRLALVGLASSGAFDACSAYQTWSSQNSIEHLAPIAANGYGDESLFTSYLSLEHAVLNECPRTEVFARQVEQPHHLPLYNIVNQLIFYAAPSTTPVADETVGEYLQRLEQESIDLDAQEQAFLRMVDEERLGLYTTEQEADEVALELLTRVGITKEQGIQGWLSFMRASDAAYGESYAETTGDASADQCAAWLADDFLTETGEPVVVTLGSLASKHHGSCYRLYNLWREARAHRYTVVPAPEPLEPAWDVLAEHARKLTEEAANEGY